VPADTDVLVVDEELRHSFDGEGRDTYTHYLLYRILTQKGADEWDSINVPWEPWHEERPLIHARVIAKDYEVHALEESEITDSPARDQQSDTYGDQRILRAPLPAIAPGVIVEEERIVREKAPFFSAGGVTRVYVGRDVPVHRQRVVLQAPSSLPLKYETRLLPNLTATRSEADGRVTILFEAGPMDALDDTGPLLPTDVPVYPSVTFATGKSWRAVAEEYSAVVDRQITGADVKAIVSRVTAGHTSREETLSALVNFLNHEVRYTGVEFGENSIVPHSPVTTLKQKYGDCKDKSALMVAMLRAAGIPSYIALLNAGLGEDVSLTLPGLGMFDHAIVYVPGPPDVWIDATDEYARLGQMPTGDQGRLALIARTGTETLMQTPILSSAENLVVEKREFYLMENGPARIVETTEPHGSFESQFRSYYADQINEDHRKSLTEYLQNQYLAEKLDRIDRTDPRDFSKQFQLILETRKGRRGYTDFQDAVAAIRLESLFDRLPFDLREPEPDQEKIAQSGIKPKKARTADYQLPVSYTIQWDYTIVPPPGFRPKPLPQNVKLNAGPAVLTEDFSADPGGIVHASIRFDTVKPRLTVAEAAALRKQVEQWKDGQAILIHFEPTAQALLREGKAREAFQSYRDLIAQHPKEALHHLQIADALLQVGLGEAAREEARTAVALEPQSALAQSKLAEVLEYDLVGRKFRPGSDYAGAEAAFRAAQKLDKSDYGITANLALLLEQNHEGRRYGMGAPLQESAAQYRSLTREQLAESGLKNNLAFVLFYAGNYAEAEQEAKMQNPQLNALVVACQTAINGSEAGLSEANKRSAEDSDRKQILKAAGEMLMNVRQYAKAADLLEAGASGENASQTAGLAALLRKTRRHEDLPAAAGPTSVAQQVFVALLDKDGLQEKAFAMASNNAQKVMRQIDSQELKKTFQVGRTFRNSMARMGTSPEIAVDLILHAMETSVDGSDDVGYRLRVKGPGAKNMTFFVVKENGNYKLLDSDHEPNAIGYEALDRVNAGNLSGARLLLDWLREELTLSGEDDPLAGHVFSRLWTKGRDSDAAGIRLAIAGLLVQSQATAKDGVAILEAARHEASLESVRTNIALALADGYSKLQQYDNLLAVSSELAKQYPDSRSAFLKQSFALRAIGRFEQLDQRAQERLQRIPEDPDALRALVQSAIARSDFALAYQRAQAVVKASRSGSSDKNQLAWLALYKGSAATEDIETALSASQQSPNNGAILHTLGCVYAELGQTKQAREVLIQSMDVQDLDEPNDDFWYAFGRIAEQLGEQKVAAAHYARLSQPKEPLMVPFSSYYLAQKRIKLLAHGEARQASAQK
jgi:transglutaminase-like putative cysteine protease/Flp pilus assembly protein TadD